MKRLLLALLLLPVLSSAQTVVNGSTSVRNDRYATTTWEALGKNNVGSPVNAGSWIGLKTVQVVVSASGEQNLTIQGSNDGTTWFTLHAIELSSGVYVELTGITSSKMAALIEDPLFVRPLISNEAGVSAVDIDVILGGVTR